MKISKTQKYKAKLLKLELLRTKISIKNKDFNYLHLKDLETRLKKALHIIYKFHVANKRILFVGTPLKLNKKVKQLLKNKKHSFIPESVWVKGIISNAGPSFKHLFKNHATNGRKTSKFLFNFKNSIDLVVVLQERLSVDVLKEISLKKVPTISLNTSDRILNSNLVTYKVLGNFNLTKKENRNNLFYLILSSLLKKAEILKKKTIKRNMKQQKTQFSKKKWTQNRKKKNDFIKKKQI